MRKLLDYSTDEILARIAIRRALNQRIAEEDEREQRQALRGHVAAKLVAAGQNSSFADDAEVRAALSRDFSYRASAQHAAKLVALRSEADAALPAEIKSERWQPGDCGCVVQRIYHRDAPEDSHTFDAIPCPAHEGLSIEELHDTLEDETQRRARTHRFIHERFEGELSERTADGGLVDKVDAGLSFAWEGVGRDRALVVQTKGVALTDEHDKAIASFAEETFGKSARVAAKMAVEVAPAKLSE